MKNVVLFVAPPARFHPAARVTFTRRFQIAYPKLTQLSRGWFRLKLNVL